MVLFGVVKRIVIVMALFYVVVYGLPYLPFVGDYIQSFFDNSKGTITGFTARNVVAPIAETIAENAQAIADNAREGYAPSPSVAPKTKFFPFKNTQVDPPKSRGTPSVSASSQTPPQTADSNAVDSSGSSPESNTELPAGCCACN